VKPSSSPFNAVQTPLSSLESPTIVSSRRNELLRS
jgi:hypothetical protein